MGYICQRGGKYDEWIDREKGTGSETRVHHRAPSRGVFRVLWSGHVSYSSSAAKWDGHMTRIDHTHTRPSEEGYRKY